jgi:predicted flap endonuclease-1-like 5' DNA nuclease
MFDIDFHLFSLVLVVFAGISLLVWKVRSFRQQKNLVVIRKTTIRQKQLNAQTPTSYTSVTKAINHSKPSTLQGIPLTKIQGIGPTFSKKLHAAGITSVEELIQYSAKDLSSTTGFSEKIASTWINNANELV